MLIIPWEGNAEFVASFRRVQQNTIVPIERCWTLWQMAKQAAWLDGEIWECGVYKGGTAALIADAIRGSTKRLRLFDSFAGIPYKDEADNHNVGDFAFADIEAVRSLVRYENTFIHKGVIPDVFAGLEYNSISFCHVDVDMYRSVLSCCEFIWYRLCVGGCMVFDDYGHPFCSGAKKEVDEFFADKGVYPILASGHDKGDSAVVFKNGST